MAVRLALSFKQPVGVGSIPTYPTNFMTFYHLPFFLELPTQVGFSFISKSNVCSRPVHFGPGQIVNNLLTNFLTGRRLYGFKYKENY